MAQKKQDHRPDPALAEPKFTGVPRQEPNPSPGIARHFSQEHDRVAEAGRLGGKPGAETRDKTRG
ncbi:hypothetical protein [Roseococcus suduntuyensis]|uniref:Uncharacterized protein n=1 Tax=Roseococcus suduntuyensis TaxID=455361 RepID=A0A840AC40_9PROT|nr:hypothetical protein [Roseococcus suduntuyensis]MBB3898657.1 hypothetical protein [Roseococcus suduntuyensis]